MTKHHCDVVAKVVRVTHTFVLTSSASVLDQTMGLNPGKTDYTNRIMVDLQIEYLTPLSTTVFK